MLVRDCNFKHVDLRYWLWVGRVIIASILTWWRPSVCVVLFQGPTFFIPFVRRPKVLNNLYSPTPNRLFSFYLVGAFRPTREFFTHMETSLLPVKGCNFWPVLETHGHSSLRVLERVTSSATRGIRLQWLSLRTHDTDTDCWAFSSGAVTACFYHLDLSRLGFEHSNYRLLGERSNSLHHCGDPE